MVLIQHALGYTVVIYHSSISVFTISYQCGRPSLRDALSHHSRNTNACDKQNNENKMPVLGSLYLFACVDVKCSHLDAQLCTMCHTMKLFSRCCYRPTMFSYHLVRCRVVEDLIDSPHLSEDCTEGQQVTQHIYPGMQLCMRNSTAYRGRASTSSHHSNRCYAAILIGNIDRF